MDRNRMEKLIWKLKSRLRQSSGDDLTPTLSDYNHEVGTYPVLYFDLFDKPSGGFEGSAVPGSSGALHRAPGHRMTYRMKGY